ncbi:MAG: histone deacetylase family protein [Acidimicrobiia bacterium]
MRMPVVFSPEHVTHRVDTGSWVGVAIPTEEVAERLDAIMRAMVKSGRAVVAPTSHDDTVLKSVHQPGMVEYMRTAHRAWLDWGYSDDPGQPDVTAYAFPIASMLGSLPLRLPVSPGALAGVYAMDTMTPIGEGTFEAARAAVDVAQSAADIVAEHREAAYAACRPPGHHAGSSFFGGSCYLNNAAAAAESLIGAGLGKVGVIDIDAHHGNGTQEIFYSRADVAYSSIHVDPGAGWFPHFVGYADETGTGPGEGFNCNRPLSPGTGDSEWLDGLDRLLDFVTAVRADALVVSLGVDAAESDPESPLRVSESGYGEAGIRIGSLGLPTVFVQEGGYVVETIGDLVGSTLDGFESAWKEKSD